MTAQTVLTVGPDGQYSTINAAIIAANKMGGDADIQVESGTYDNDGGKILVDNVTLEGIGGPVSIFAPPASAGTSAGLIADGHNILLKNWISVAPAIRSSPLPASNTMAALSP